MDIYNMDITTHGGYVTHIGYETNDLWDLLFHNLDFVEAAHEKAIHFSILSGLDGYHALIVTNRGNRKLTQRWWEYFEKNLRKPYKLDLLKAQIEFPEQKVILNIYGLLHTSTPHVVVADQERLIYEYYKSGTIPMRSVAIRTYGEDREAYYKAVQELDERGGIKGTIGGYELTFVVMGQLRTVRVVESVLYTLPD